MGKEKREEDSSRKRKKCNEYRVAVNPIDSLPGVDVCDDLERCAEDDTGASQVRIPPFSLWICGEPQGLLQLAMEESRKSFGDGNERKGAGAY